MNLFRRKINYLKNLKNLFEECDVLIYAENESDRNHLYLIMNELIKKKLKIFYISSDVNDEFLNPKLKSDDRFESFYLSKGMLRTFIFNFLKSKLVVMTLTDLDNKFLKRSKFVKNYLYIFHSITSTHMCYLENSFDNYDVLFCTGNHQIREIRKREELFKLKSKKLIPYCHPRIEALRNFSKLKKNNLKKIIIASSWGESSIIETLSNSFYENLLNNDYEVLLQLHSMSEKRMKEIKVDLKYLQKNYLKFSWTSKYIPIENLTEYCLMISDWSGAATEFTFGLEKPVIFIDLPKKIRNKNYKDLKLVPLEISIRKKIGIVLKLEDLNLINKKIDELLKISKTVKWKRKIKSLSKKILFSYEDNKKKVNVIIDELVC